MSGSNILALLRRFASSRRIIGSTSSPRNRGADCSTSQRMAPGVVIRVTLAVHADTDRVSPEDLRVVLASRLHAPAGMVDPALRRFALAQGLPQGGNGQIHELISEPDKKNECSRGEGCLLVNLAASLLQTLARSRFPCAEHLYLSIPHTCSNSIRPRVRHPACCGTSVLSCQRRRRHHVPRRQHPIVAQDRRS